MARSAPGQRTSPKRLVAAVVVSVLGLWAGFSLGQWQAPSTEVTGKVDSRVLVTATTYAPTTTASTTIATTTEASPPRAALLAFTGDTLAHRGVVRQAATYGADSGTDYDFAPMFALVEPYLSSADIAICHLETPLSPDNSNLSGYPTFNVPHELAQALADVGYDGCTTASNHSLDRRVEGITDTLDVLDAAALQHSGTARSADEREEPTVYDANGIAVANLSYSYGFNGFSTPADEPWRANLIEPDVIIADAAAAKASGAEYVVVSLHWGNEYQHDPTVEQVSVADELTGRDEIDLIIGHHAHVVQPIEVRNGTPVVFGLGNFLSNQSAICCVAGSQDGAIVEISILEIDPLADRVEFETSVSVIETWVDRSDFTIIPVAEALADPEIAGGNSDALAKSLERTQAVMSSGK